MLKRSVLMWMPLPAPVEEYSNFGPRSFASAMNSLTDLTPSDGATVSAPVVEPTLRNAAEILGRQQAALQQPDVMANAAEVGAGSISASGVACATMVEARVPPPPLRFSSRTGCFPQLREFGPIAGQRHIGGAAQQETDDQTDGLHKFLRRLHGRSGAEMNAVAKEQGETL